MRHALATASMLALLAAAPVAAFAQPNGPPGQRMGPGPNQYPMGNPNSMENPNMMSGQGGMPGPGMMEPGRMSGPGGMAGPNMMSGPQGMAGPGGMSERRYGMRGPINDQDRKFIEEAASAGLAEVQAGHLAMQRGETTAVREFGRWMATDHTEMGEMLAHQAERAGLMAPSQMNAKDRDNLEQLKRYTGAEFDHRYLMDQVDAHKQAMELFKQEAQSGQSPPLRWFAHHMEAMLTEHLAEAQELRGVPESVAAHSAHARTPEPMAEAVKAPPKLQEGTTPGVRQSLNKEGAQRVEKEGK